MLRNSLIFVYLYDVVCSSHPHTTSPYCFDDHFSVVTDLLRRESVEQCNCFDLKLPFEMSLNFADDCIFYRVAIIPKTLNSLNISESSR